MVTSASYGIGPTCIDTCERLATGQSDKPQRPQLLTLKSAAGRREAGAIASALYQARGGCSARQRPLPCGVDVESTDQFYRAGFHCPGRFAAHRGINRTCNASRGPLFFAIWQTTAARLPPAESPATAIRVGSMPSFDAFVATHSVAA